MWNRKCISFDPTENARICLNLSFAAYLSLILFMHDAWLGGLIGPGKRGHIVAHDVSWARKRAGHKMNVVFPCCAN